MFSKAERVCLSDANELRFLSVSVSREKSAAADLPGPAHYTPNPPGGWSTQRHIFLKGKRRPLNAEELKKNTPAPGTYDRHDSLGDGSGSGLPGVLSATGDDVDIPLHIDTSRPSRRRIATSRTPRYMNMINVNNQHGLAEYAVATRGPGEYDLPGLWRAGRGRNARRQQVVGCSSPAATMETRGRNAGPGTFSRLDAALGPGEFPIPPPPPAKGGHLSIVRRDLAYIPQDDEPGPGQYTPTRLSTRLGIQINSYPRRLGEVVCGNDLRKQKRQPGPGSYHPIFRNIVKQEYTV